MKTFKNSKVRQDGCYFSSAEKGDKYFNFTSDLNELVKVFAVLI